MERDCESELSKLNIEQNACIYHFGASVIHGQRSNILRLPWLNMIESFFSKMTRQMLRGIRVNTKQELEERIYKYFDEVNREPVVYHWKYKMDEISEEEAVSI